MTKVSWAMLLAWLASILLFLGIDSLRSKDKSYFKISGKTDWQTIAEKIGPAASSVLPIFNMTEINKQLTWAGRPYGLTAAGFVGIKIIALIGGVLAGLGLIALGMPPLTLPLTAAILYFLPDSWLKSAYKKRQEEIYQMFPIFVSLLGTAIAAGVEINPAMLSISNIFPGALGDELRIAWREQATGQAWASSLRLMCTRIGVPIVDRFFETLITASERGGINLSVLIGDFRKELIASQRRKIEEQARKTPTKMVLPMIFCVFVPIVLLMLTPAMLTMFQSM